MYNVPQRNLSGAKTFWSPTVIVGAVLAYFFIQESGGNLRAYTDSLRNEKIILGTSTFLAGWLLGGAALWK